VRTPAIASSTDSFSVGTDLCLCPRHAEEVRTVRAAYEEELPRLFDQARVDRTAEHARREHQPHFARLCRLGIRLQGRLDSREHSAPVPADWSVETVCVRLVARSVRAQPYADPTAMLATPAGIVDVIQSVAGEARRDLFQFWTKQTFTSGEKITRFFRS